MKNVLTTMAEKACSVVKDMDTNSKNIYVFILILILVFGICFVMNRVMRNGYSFTVTYSKEEKIEIKLNPPNKSEN